MRAVETSTEIVRRQRWEVAKARALAILEKFDPDQPRDEQGRWTSGGGGAGSATDKPSVFRPGPGDAALYVSPVNRTSTKFKFAVKNALNKLPSQVADKLNESGVIVRTGKKPTDIFPELKGLQPIGWPKGTTYDHMEANFNRLSNSINIAETKQKIGSKEFEPNTRVEGAINHEAGHAYDEALGAASESISYQNAYYWDKEEIRAAKNVTGLEYFLDDRIGPSEAFAEIFAQNVGKGSMEDDIRPYFPKTTEWVQKLIDTGTFERAFQKFDPDQPRDEQGRWTSGGGSAAGAADKPAAPPPGFSSWPLPITERSPTSQGFKKKIARAMAEIPSDVRQTLEDNGASFVIGEKFTDIKPELKDITPRGWPEGMTYDHVEATYTRSTKNINIAETVKSSTPILALEGLEEPEQYALNNRIESAVFHEGGHAYDDALGWASQSESFRKAYEEDLEELDYYPEYKRQSLGYFLQGGEAGPQELFAELFAEMHGWPNPGPSPSQYFPRTREWIDKLRETGEIPKAFVSAVEKFDPDQPRDELGRWTSGGGGGAGGDGGAPAAPLATPDPREARRERLGPMFRGGRANAARVASWRGQIQSKLKAYGETWNSSVDNLGRIDSALNKYQLVHQGDHPLRRTTDFHFIYSADEKQNDANGEPELLGAVASVYDEPTKVVTILDDGGVNNDARTEVLAQTVEDYELVGYQRVESVLYKEDEQGIKAYEDAGFKRGQEWGGFVKLYWGDEITQGEIELRQRATEQHYDNIRSSANSVASDLGFDASKITLGNNDDPNVNFVLNGKQLKAAGVAHVYDENPAMRGTIKLFPEQLPNVDAAKGVTAHEIKHVKFQSVVDRAVEQGRQFMNETPPPPNPDADTPWGRRGGPDAMIAADGTLRPAYAEKYPIFAALQDKYNRYSTPDFARADGVSNYSAEYWKQWDKDPSAINYRLAVHETLAEMARIKYTTGKFPIHRGMAVQETPSSKNKVREGTVRWRDLYRTIERLYQ